MYTSGCHTLEGNLGAMIEDEFRVEVELDADHDGLSLSERLRAFDLDEEARGRLGSQVTVTRDRSHLFLYAHTRESCAEAERVVREILAADEISASVVSTRWHPIAREWKDTDLPMPEAPEEISAEERERAEHADESDEQPVLRPEFVLLDSYKPEFLRDLGL